MIPVYNCSHYLTETLRSVLEQDMGAALMQIQVVDDASTDADVEKLVASLGAGRVEYFRQPQNVGSLRNFETCINRASGQLVQLLHGDDRVLPGFYEKITDLFERYPDAGAAFTRYAFIDEQGQRLALPPAVAEQEGLLDNWLLNIAEHQSIQYACIAVRRRVYEQLGSFYGTTYGEDWEMWVRIARYYPVAYSPEVLAEYRDRSHSISWEKARAGQIVPDLVGVINRIEQHLPAKDRKRITNVSRRFWALLNINLAYRVFRETKDEAFAQRQVRQSLELSTHPSVYYSILKFYVKVLVGKEA